MKFTDFMRLHVWNTKKREENEARLDQAWGNMI